MFSFKHQVDYKNKDDNKTSADNVSILDLLISFLQESGEDYQSEDEKHQKTLLQEEICDIISTGTYMEYRNCKKPWLLNAIDKGEKYLLNLRKIAYDSIDSIDSIPVISLVELNIKNYSETELPEELKQLPITKPGSREYFNHIAIQKKTCS